VCLYLIPSCILIVALTKSLYTQPTLNSPNKLHRDLTHHQKHWFRSLDSHLSRTNSNSMHTSSCSAGFKPTAHAAAGDMCRHKYIVVMVKSSDNVVATKPAKQGHYYLDHPLSHSPATPIAPSLPPPHRSSPSLVSPPSTLPLFKIISLTWAICRAANGSDQSG
jgi:hypothetical protein